MAKIILEANSRYNANSDKIDIYSPNYKVKYHARILVDVNSEIFCTQIQFISNDSKSMFWTNDELLLAFNKAYTHIKCFVDTDSQIKIFDENLFFPESEKLQSNELINEFQIEIQEDKKNTKILNGDLQKINEVNNNFKKCQDKLFEVINWGPDLINRYYYNISNLIDYVYRVANAGVVIVPNNEKLSNIKNSFNELKGRKITQNHTYQTNVNIAQRAIYTLDFPKYFKSVLPQDEIDQVLNEIR
jgi:hypothetical protein